MNIYEYFINVILPFIMYMDINSNLTVCNCYLGRGFQGRILLKAVDGVTSMFSLQLLRDACEFEKKYVIKHRKHKG